MMSLTKYIKYTQHTDNSRWTCENEGGKLRGTNELGLSNFTEFSVPDYGNCTCNLQTSLLV
jgi:hypothetical protein